MCVSNRRTFYTSSNIGAHIVKSYIILEMILEVMKLGNTSDGHKTYSYSDQEQVKKIENHLKLFKSLEEDYTTGDAVIVATNPEFNNPTCGIFLADLSILEEYQDDRPYLIIEADGSLTTWNHIQ